MATKMIPLDTVPLDIRILAQKNSIPISEVLKHVETYQAKTASEEIKCFLESQVLFQIEEFKRLVDWTFGESGVVLSSQVDENHSQEENKIEKTMVNVGKKEEEDNSKKETQVLKRKKQVKTESVKVKSEDKKKVKQGKIKKSKSSK